VIRTGGTLFGGSGRRLNSHHAAPPSLLPTYLVRVAPARRYDRPGWDAFFFSEVPATVWITRSHDAACDAYGRAIPADRLQYELLMKKGREVRLDRTCLQRHLRLRHGV